MTTITKNIYKIFIGVSLFALTSPASAQQVSEEEALLRSSRLFLSSADKTGETNAKGQRRVAAQKPSIAHKVKSGSNVNLYVVNNGADGFAIVSGDDRTDAQILGYSSEGSFDYDNAPDGLKALLGLYSSEIDILRSTAASTSNSQYSESKGVTVVDMLMTSQWGQSVPYYNLCPKKYPVGCVAIAMGQIMNYWKYPEQPNGHISNVNVDGVNTSISYDLESSIIDWDNIHDSYDSENYNDTTIARLVYNIGLSVNMAYSQGFSGATLANAQKSFVNNYHYSNSMKWVSYSNKSQYSQLVATLKQELDCKRPVLYSGGRHAFVCDGYTTDEAFHINWGWAGSYDGWYHFTSSRWVNGEYGHEYLYPDNNIIQVLINIHP